MTVGVVPGSVNRDLAIAVGFLFAVCLVLGAVAWVAMNYLEDDLDGFSRYVQRQGT